LEAGIFHFILFWGRRVTNEIPGGYHGAVAVGGEVKPADALRKFFSYLFLTPNTLGGNRTVPPLERLCIFKNHYFKRSQQ